MSEVTRYKTTGTAFGPALTECPNGNWVSYADYYYLAAEVERLRNASTVNAVSAEQYERVVKAGDAFIGTYLFASAKGLVSQDIAAKVIEEWQAAKEGTK